MIHIRYAGFQIHIITELLPAVQRRKRTEKMAELNRQFHDREDAPVCSLRFIGGGVYYVRVLL